MLCIYYANWSIYGGSRAGLQVKDLPWDRLAVINHAFWRIEPSDDFSTFPIAPIDTAADLGSGMCFDQYTEMTALFPDVAVVLSIGGWTDTRWFSRMARTEAGRRSFIDSCIETLKEYPFLGGIDIDWEYPGSSRDHEGEAYVGSSDDGANFTALMRELRESFDAADLADKIITYCAPSSSASLRDGRICIDFAAIDPYVARVNVMTYDMAGSWSSRALHHSALHPGRAVEAGASVAEIVAYILSLGVPAAKINIGSPLYTRGWVVEAANGAEALGKTVADGAAESFEWYEIVRMEGQPGWETLYDEESQAAYLYNSDPDSRYYQHFYSYESHRSLQAKLDYIDELGLGGMIVWDAAGDSAADDFPMMTRMAAALSVKRISKS